jgi:Uma2 family endonuclease
MPTAVTEVPYRAVPTDPPRKRWTRTECAAMEASGVWDQQRYELVEGELIEIVPKKRPHVFSLTRILAWAMDVFGADYVNPETSIDVAPQDNPTSEPEPDVIVLTRPMGEIMDRNPQPPEVRLVIEVSDASLGFDLTRKAALYARAGIADYWVVDIAARRFVVHRDPREGAYGSITVYSDQEFVAPLAAPDRAFRIADAFPPIP